MKNILIILILFSQPLIGKSQTKKATEDWILSKFNKYKITSTNNDNFHPYNAVPISLKFNECFIEFKEEFTQLGVFDIKPEIRLYKVMIGDIQSFTWNKNILVIKTRKYNVSIKSYLKSNGSSKMVSDYSNLIILTFNIQAEPKLDERLTIALEHLKSFCFPSTDEKEAF